MSTIPSYVLLEEGSEMLKLQEHSASKNFNFCLEDRISMLNRSFYRDLLKSRSFTRLRDITFLGAIDYVAAPTRNSEFSRRQTRLDHSLGVALLAKRYARLKMLSPAEEMPLVAAALMHDIGHAPLSHSLEPVFYEHFGIDHHAAGEMRLRGGSYIAQAETAELQKIFAAYHVDIDEVVALINGAKDHPHGFLFWHPINIDTIEGISRSRTYINPRLSLFSKEKVLDALISTSGTSEGETLDRFWETKGTVYARLIQGAIGILADETARRFMKTNIKEFRLQDFFMGERFFRFKHKRLFATLKNIRGTSLNVHHARHFEAFANSIKRRSFHIDVNVSPGNPLRYLQNRSKES